MKSGRFSPPVIVLFVAAVVSSCAARTSYVDLYGMPGEAWAAQRTIIIRPDTRYVNVEGGEIIRFLVGDKEFVWNFYVAQTVHNFDLQEVAPPGVLDHQVQAYISPDPRYIGGNGRGDM